MIKINGLNKYYNKGKSNELHVINDTSVTLDDTGLVCILGESGSGKTTLMNTISGLDDFAKGSIDVDGIEIKKYGDSNQERVRNEKFGYIFQNYYLLQDRTVEYNLMISLSLYDISEEEKEERIDYVLKAVDMWRYKKRLVSQLSGGQQQRVAIARALAKAPKVIFADEPTGNLDEANTMRIMGILKKVSKTCLVVVVTHERTIADFFADRILWISDGKIEKEQLKENQTAYQYIEDTNIYLQEYEKKQLADEKINVEVYSNDELPDLGIKLIYQNSKIYISIGDEKNIELLTVDSEKKIIDSKKPIIELTDIDELEYSLETLESSKKPKMGFKEIRNIAKSNILSMGKKQIFLVLSLFVMAVMMVLATQDIMTIANIKEQDVVKNDSHYIHVTLKKGSQITTDKFNEQKREILDRMKKESGLYENITLVPTTSLTYQYIGFLQLENLDAKISTYSFTDINKLDSKDIKYGRMPENEYEIVVDEWVLDKFVENSAELSNVINDNRHFLDKTVKTINEIELTIVGISSSEEMDIYIDKYLISQVSSWSQLMMTQSKFNELYPDASTVSLGVNEDGEVQILEAEKDYLAKWKLEKKTLYPEVYSYSRVAGDCEQYKEWLAWQEQSNPNGDDANWLREQVATLEAEMTELEATIAKNFNGMTQAEAYEYLETPMEGFGYKKELSSTTACEVVGSIPTAVLFEQNVEIVVPDDQMEKIMEDLYVNRGDFNIYADDKDSVKKFFAELPSSILKDINVIIVDSYEEALSEYRAEKADLFNGRIIVTVTIFFVSMIILYFMMKANAVQRMQDLGVYRLIGISKMSIIGLFAYENVLITSYTSLIGAILATFVTNIIASIPSLNADINYPWYAFLGTVAFLYLSNVLIGIMPIRKILRLPPAQLASKYDI